MLFPEFPQIVSVDLVIINTRNKNNPYFNFGRPTPYAQQGSNQTAACMSNDSSHMVELSFGKTIIETKSNNPVHCEEVCRLQRTW